MVVLTVMMVLRTRVVRRLELGHARGRRRPVMVGVQVGGRRRVVVVRRRGRVSGIMGMVMTMMRTRRREGHRRGGMVLMMMGGPGVTMGMRVVVGHHPRGRGRHAVRRHVGMEMIGRAVDAIVLAVSRCHGRRTAAAALRSALG